MEERDWWNNKSYDDQIWLMMKHGYFPHEPKTIKYSDIKEIYNLEHNILKKNGTKEEINCCFKEGKTKIG